MKNKNTLKRKFYPTHIVEKAIKKYIKKKISKGNSQIIKEKDTPKVWYIKFPYIGKVSAQKRL